MRFASDATELTGQIATRAYDRWARRHESGHLEDWLEAEQEIQQLHVLTQRVAELEAQAELATETVLSHQLTETESRLASLLAECRRADCRLVAEHAVASLLMEFTEFSESGPRILRAICEALEWDVGVFWLCDRATDVLRCVDVWHASAVEVNAFAQATRDRTFALGVGLPGCIWASGQPAWMPVVADDGNYLPTASAVPNRSGGAIGFPIHDGVEFLGVMEFFGRDVQPPGAELSAMMAGIGGQISQFIQRRRAETRLQREDEQRRLARKVQEGLLPKSSPPLAGFTIGAQSWPCYDVGGDYFDTFLLSDGTLALVIADVSGHALGSALVTAGTRAYVRAFARSFADPSAILTQANQQLCEDLAGSHFVTLFLGRLDPHTGVLKYAGAGHCPGYVLSPDGQIKATLLSQGLPLGVTTDGCYPPGAVSQLAAGDLLFLYTDGIVESGSRGVQGLFGIERTLDAVRAHRQESPDKILAAIYQAVSGFAPGCDQADDMTAILVKVDSGHQVRSGPGARLSPVRSIAVEPDMR